jgi:hypothetical protein
MKEKIAMPGFIVRTSGSREYLPKEYRGAPQDYYAYRIAETRRQREASLQMKKARVAQLERDLLLDARFRFSPRSSGIRISEPTRIRFAPRI